MQDAVLVDVGFHGMIAAIKTAFVDQQSQPATVFEREAVDAERPIAIVFIKFCIRIITLTVAKMSGAILRAGIGLRLELFVQIFLRDSLKYLKGDTFAINGCGTCRRFTFVVKFIAVATVAQKQQ